MKLKDTFVEFVLSLLIVSLLGLTTNTEAQQSKYIYGESIGNCPAGTKIATASVLMEQDGCSNLGGTSVSSLAGDNMVNCQLDWCGANSTEEISGIVAAVQGNCPGSNATKGNIGSWQLCQKFYKGLTNGSEENNVQVPCHLEWCRKERPGSWYSFSFSSDMCDINNLLPAPLLNMSSIACEDIGGEVYSEGGGTQPCQINFCRLGFNKAQQSKYIYGESIGNCSAGTKIATASVLMEQDGCSNLGGTSVSSLAGDNMVNCQLDWCGANSTEEISGIVAAVQGNCPGSNATKGNIGSWQLCQKFYKGLTNGSEENNVQIPCHLEWCRKERPGSWYSFSFSSDMCDINNLLPAPLLNMSSIACEDIGGEVYSEGGGTQPCQIKFCRLGFNKECKLTQMGQDFNGTISTTISGRQCQRWDSNVPHIHYETDPKKFPDETLADASNYCRNPAGYTEGPFCYTTDDTVPFEYCDIPYCPGEKPTVKDHRFGVNHYIFVPGLHHDPWGFCRKLYGADGVMIESNEETEELSRWLNELVEEKQVQYDEIWIGGRAPLLTKTGDQITDLQSIVKHGMTGHCLLVSKWNDSTKAYDSDKFHIYAEECPDFYKQFICESMEYEIKNYEVDGGIPQMEINDLESCKLSCKDECHALGYNIFEESCWHYFNDEDCKPGRPSWGFHYYQKAPCECHKNFVMMEHSVEMNASSVYPRTDNILANSAERAKLNTKEEGFSGGINLGAWVPAITNENQWIEARFKNVKLIYGVVTLGSIGVQQGMVTSFNIQYSAAEGCESLVFFKGLDNKIKAFTGNKYADVMVTSMFDHAIYARCIRILPKKWNLQIALRFDVMGCNERENLALGKPTKPEQSSKTAALAVDGYPHTSFSWKSCSLSDEMENPWLAIDLENLYLVNEIKIYTRRDCCVGQLSKLSVRIQMVLEDTDTASSENECAFIAGNVESASTITIDCSLKMGRYVVLQKKTHSTDRISVCEAKVYGNLAKVQNIALNKPANQSSTLVKWLPARLANDGIKGKGGSIFSRTNFEKDPWWIVDLQQESKIYSISLTARGDCCEERLDYDFYIYVGNGRGQNGKLLENHLCAKIRLKKGETRYISCIRPVNGRYGKVMLDAANGTLTLVEVEIFGHEYSPAVYGGNADADECEFPFIYNGTKHDDCIKTNERPLLWCGVTRNYDEDLLWRHCQDVKLSGGRDDSEGTVLVRYSTNEHWGTVCDDDWDDHDARVVCKQLGFKDGVAKYQPYFEQGSGTIIMGNLMCSGNESSLFQCPRKMQPPNCLHHEDAGVKCTVTDRALLVGYPNIRRHNADTLMQGIVIIQSKQQITVPGKLVAWHFYSRAKGAILKLQIWRRVYDLKGERYMLVGQVHASEALTEDGLVKIINPTVTHLESGDLLGFTFKNGNPISFDYTFHCGKHGVIRYNPDINVTIGSIRSFPAKEDDLDRHCKIYSLYAELEVEKRPYLKSFQFGGHLYTIYNSLQTLTSTQHLCDIDNAYLYHVNNPTEYQYTIQKLAETGITGSFWVNNTLVDSRFVTSWADCQPEKGKECMVISNENNDNIFQWYSKSCIQQYYYICEWNIPGTNASHWPTIKPDEMNLEDNINGKTSVVLPVVLSLFAILFLVGIIVFVVFYLRKRQGGTIRDFLPNELLNLSPTEGTSALVPTGEYPGEYLTKWEN